MTEREEKAIDLKFRTEGETHAYIEGYLSAVNKFCYWLGKEPTDKAINTMLVISAALDASITKKGGTDS